MGSIVEPSPVEKMANISYEQKMVSFGIYLDYNGYDSNI